MSPARTLVLTALAMTAFAGNSLLCRLALRNTAIDAASFTAIRLVSGALVLWLIARRFRRDQSGSGNWPSALALFAYAAAFSFAYRSLPAGAGALLLFGAVQATMIGWGLWSGERLRAPQLAGLALALGGLSGLLLPGVSAPPLGPSASLSACQGCSRWPFVAAHSDRILEGFCSAFPRGSRRSISARQCLGPWLKSLLQSPQHSSDDN